MSTIITNLESSSRSRLRSFVWPREHGAWGILLVPLVVGGWVGAPGWKEIGSLALFGVAAVAVFCLRTPVECWLELSPFRPQTVVERQVILYSLMVYACVAGAALDVMLWGSRAQGLLLLGAVVAVTFAAQAVLKKLGPEARMSSQWMGALGLTSTTAGAYYVVRGQIDQTALSLWLLNWLFAANQIHFVQLRIHTPHAIDRAEKFSKGRGFLMGQVLTAALLGLTWHFGAVPGMALLAFAPVLSRGLLWFFRHPAPLKIRRLGMSELAHALAFGALFILGFKLGSS